MPKYTEQDFNNQMNYLSNTKTLMMQAIANKGQNITNYTPFREYANIISNIEAGSSSPLGPNSNIIHFQNMEEMSNYQNVSNLESMAFVYDNLNNQFEGMFKGTGETNPYSYKGIKIKDVSDETPYLDYEILDEVIDNNLVDTLREILLEEDPSLNNNDCSLIEKIDNNNYAVYVFDLNVTMNYLGQQLPILNHFNNVPLAITDYNKIIQKTGDGNINLVLDIFYMSEGMSVLKPFIETLAITLEDDSTWFSMDRYEINIQTRNISKQTYNLAKYIGGTSLCIKDIDFRNRNLYCAYLSPDKRANQSNQKDIMIYYKEDISGESTLKYTTISLELVDAKTMIFDKALVQFTADSTSVVSGWFYGNNGVEFGEMFDNKTYDANDIDKLPKRLNVYYNGNRINTTGLTNCFNYFNNSSITNIPPFNTSDVTNMSYMFNRCNLLVKAPLLNTSDVTDMNRMFYSCSNLSIIPNYSTSKVTDMSYMFYSCENLKVVPNFDTSNVTNMYGMFSGSIAANVVTTGMSNLTTVPNFNTINVVNMSAMFRACTNLTIVPKFNTSKVTNMLNMFSFCHNLKVVPKFNTSNVTTMSGMFRHCYNLSTVPNFNTLNVTTMARAFCECYNLIELPNFDTSNVTSMLNMCQNCWNLISIPKWNLSSLTSANYIFENCPNLSNESYHNIAEALPLASQLSNQYISKLGLDENRFTDADKYNLIDKGYLGITEPISEKYIISYE